MRENIATPEGRELGAEIARLCEQEAQRLARDGRCATCACRAGGHVANGSPETLMTFVKCIAEREPFFCHEEDRPCAGYLLMRFDSDKTVEVPWDSIPDAD